MTDDNENSGRMAVHYCYTDDALSVDNIMSLTESTCVSVESLEDGTFYEDDNDEFVATLSEMSEKDRLNYSDDELLDEYCRESEVRMSESVDDTIQRVMTNLEEFKLQRQRERRRRERMKCLHLVLAVIFILLVASLGVGLRILMSTKPFPKPARDKPLPTHQYIMDWNPDFPESVVPPERRIPILWSSIYSFDHWFSGEEKKND